MKKIEKSSNTSFRKMSKKSLNKVIGGVVPVTVLPQYGALCQYGLDTVPPFTANTIQVGTLPQYGALCQYGWDTVPPFTEK